MVLVRPRPFVPPPLPVQLWHLVRRPAAGVALVLRAQPGLAAVAAWLCAAGLVQVLVASLFGRAEWRSSYFLLHAIAAPFTAWALVTLPLCAAGFRKRGAAPRRAFQVTGVAMCAGPLLAAAVPFPAVACLLCCAWLAAVCYQTAIQLCGPGRLGAVTAALAGPVALAALWLTLHA